MEAPTQALFLGGRSGVGKSTVALEVSRILAAADVAHALIEGDALDQAHPEPWRQGIPLAEREIGSGFAESVARSAAAAPRLEAEAADAVHRVATDGRTVAEIAAEVVALSGWCPVDGR
jgi:ABC-type iron transport system FetAB ATPase subunit